MFFCLAFDLDFVRCIERMDALAQYLAFAPSPAGLGEVLLLRRPASCRWGLLELFPQPAGLVPLSMSASEAVLHHTVLFKKPFCYSEDPWACVIGH